MTVLGPAYSATAGLPFDADDLESRLVWLWGSPRSGSTWLLEQLCHPLTPHVRAPAGFRRATPSSRADDVPAAGYDALPVDEPFIANHLAPAFGDPLEVDGEYVPATLNNYLGRKPGYALSKPYEEVWRPEVRRLALVRLNGVVERAAAEGLPVADAPLVVLKEVNGSHASDLVMSVLRRSRMLFLVRDGRDVVDSLLAAYAPGGFLARNQQRAIETPEERSEALRWASRLWACNVDVTLRAHAEHPPELSRIVRYEDLLADTRATIEPLFDWLGLRRTDAWLDRMVSRHAFSSLPEGARGEGSRQRAATPGLWRERLSEEDQRVVSEIMGPRLHRLGYEA